MKVKLVKESLNEVISFERRKDPLSTLGIGQRKLIENWLKEMEIDKYTINDDLSIDVDTDVNLEGKNIIKFPKYIQFNRINRGNFYCAFCNLISLIRCPKYIQGSFYCTKNNLISLDGCPKYVGGNFYCHHQLSGITFTREDIKRYCKVGRKIFS